jgi:uncharacterized protein with HEPN domain
MPFRDTERHFQDVLEAIERIEQFVGDMGFAEYRVDDKTKSAVERKIQILTEAIIRIEEQSPGEFPEIDQKGFRGMGNILRHSYHRVDDAIVWETVKGDLPELKSLVNRILLELKTKKTGQ